MLSCKRSLVALTLLVGCASTTTPPANDGHAHASKIAWEDWAPPAFARARAEDKLILVNVAAGWCHWCHVMDERTFADDEVAALIAERFVAIRVDADARPDVAERYQRWGWPATAVLTPDARPVTERRGYQEARGFAKLLRELSDAQRAGRSLARVEAPPPPPRQTDASGLLRAQLDAFWDEAQAGWGTVQKYPFAAPIEHALLRASLRSSEAVWRERAVATLRAQTALIDPVWGGMFQYSDDGTWGGGRHWEKIALVQAGALESYALGYRATGDATLLEPGRAIHRYVAERLRTPDGTFLASQDADPPAGSGLDGEAFYALDDARRRRSPRPRLDPHVYADQNGLLIAALCRWHAVTGEAAPLEQALAAAETLLRTHGVPARPGAFRHAASSPDAPLFLADQVQMGAALLALAEVTGEARWLDAALASARVVRDDFALQGGGFRAATRVEGTLDDDRLPWRENALAARFHLRVFAMTEDDAWRTLAARTVWALLADPERAKSWGRLVGDALLAVEELTLEPVSIHVVGRFGPDGDPAAQALLQAARRAYVRHGVVVPTRPGARYPDLGRAAAFICGLGTCSAPVEKPEELPRALEAFAPTLGDGLLGPR
jgi:uncharacterized protein YyaL (SSP411 family)